MSDVFYLVEKYIKLVLTTYVFWDIYPKTDWQVLGLTAWALYTDLSLLTLLRLTSCHAAVIISTATQGCRLTTDINMSRNKLLLKPT